MSGVKRQKLDHESVSCTNVSDSFCETQQHYLLDISDDVLVHILSHLPGSDLYNLSRTCERFHTLCQDRTFWEVADFRKCRMRVDELGSILRLLRPHTKFLAIRGFADVTSRGEAGILPKSFLACLPDSCPNLETFIVEDFYIDVDEVDCRDFPGMVKCLSLKGCQVVDSAKVRCLSTEKSHFFLQVYVHLPNLEKLVLSYCRWFRLHSLMAISKCANLVELRLDGIRHLHDNVPYLSLATSFGFRKLKILDMRNTTVGSSAMRGFNNLLNLTHLYLECPPQYRQKETITPVPSTSRHCPESSDEDCEEVNQMQGHDNSCLIVLRFGGSPEIWHNDMCTNLCNSNETTNKTQVQQNSKEDEDASKQDGSGQGDLVVHYKEFTFATTSKPEVSGNAIKISFDVENVNAEDKNNENCKDSDNNTNADKSDQSEPHTQNQNTVEEIKMSSSKIEVHGESETCRTKPNTETHCQTVTSSNVDEELCHEKKLQRNQKEQEKVSSRPVIHNIVANSNNEIVDKKKHKTQHSKGCCAPKGKHDVEGNDSSDNDSSDDEPNSEGLCRQPGCGLKSKKSACSHMLRHINCSSTSNIRSLKQPCSGGRHEELIDDLSIDYFLSRDMWRVSLDGNIVRCNDRSPQLHTLVIRFYPHVTDKTLTLLHRITSLRYVDVTGTKVTEKGVDWFRVMRPDVTVDSDFGPPK